MQNLLFRSICPLHIIFLQRSRCFDPSNFDPGAVLSESIKIEWAEFLMYLKLIEEIASILEFYFLLSDLLKNVKFCK